MMRFSVISSTSNEGSIPDRAIARLEPLLEPFVGELLRRNVHRDFHASEAGVDPRAQLLAGLLDDPFADRDDELGLFGEEDELGRRRADPSSGGSSG